MQVRFEVYAVVPPPRPCRFLHAFQELRWANGDAKLRRDTSLQRPEKGGCAREKMGGELFTLAE
jgi:hypothetical protein